MTVQRTLAAICWALLMVTMILIVITGCIRMGHPAPATPQPTYSHVQLPTL